jgi:L-histidine N-alpha-methyltransferase
VDTTLVARRAVYVETARHGAIVLRQGESIRTAVDCKFDRGRVDAMLSGVGLRATSWWTDAADRFAVLVAAPAA